MQPPGLCPVCGYAIGAGRCPECGSTIAPEKLLKTRSEYHRKRFLRALLRWLWVPLLLGGASYTYYYIDWMTWIPTRVLLLCQDDQRDPSTRELMRRFDAGIVSSAQLLGMRDSGLSTFLEVDERMPYPAGVPLPVHVGLTLQLPHRVWGIKPAYAVLELNGQVVVRHRAGDEVAWKEAFPEVPGRLLVPGLSAGAYEVGVSGTARLREFGSQEVIYTWPVAMEAVVVIEEQRFSNYVKPVSSAAWKSDVARTLEIRVISPWPCLGIDRRFCHDAIIISSSGTSVPIAGTLWVRAEESARFVRLPKPFIAWSEERLFSVDLPASRAFSQSAFVDVRIVPDPSFAFAAHFDEYFDGVIEWADVPIEMPSPVLASEEIDGLLPTWVRNGVPTENPIRGVRERR